MRVFFGTVLSIIAMGVLLIAYGLLAPRAAASMPIVTDASGNVYQLAQPVGQQLPGGQMEVVRYAQPYAQPAASQPAVVRYVPAASSQSSQREPIRRRAVSRGRDWKKTAM